MKKLYTFLLEIDGGTYISQINAINIEDSVIQWITSLEIENSKEQFISLEIVSGLKNEIFISDLEKPTELDGLKNVWCLSFSIKEHLALINIVETTGLSN